jgi:hypothetical protein
MAFTPLTVTATSIINKGVAEITTGLKDASAAISLTVPNLTLPDLPGMAKTGAAEASTKVAEKFTRSLNTKSNSKSGEAIQHKPNPLGQFASYNSLWTLAVLTREQLNDPTLYRDKPVSSTSIVIASAGRFDEGRIRTQYGAPEYFINNIDITSLVGPNPKTGNASAHTFKFEVTEPYSMGLFLQSLNAAAKNAGHANYLNNCPYLLRLDIQGWGTDAAGNSFQIMAPTLSRYFVIRLVNTTFECDQGGSKYNVEATPFSATALGNVVNKTYTDINIGGSTVKEALATGERSLVKVINDRFESMKKDGLVAEPDQLLVIFPGDQSAQKSNTPEGNDKATVNPGAAEGASAPAPAGTSDMEVGSNAISDSDLGFTLESGGNPSFMKNSDIMDPSTGFVNREKVTIDPKSRAFMFAQGQAISDVITEIVLNSEYVRKSAEQLKKNPDGTVAWFRLDGQIKLGNFDVRRNDYAKIIIFRVLQYNVHSSIFQNPSTAPQGYKELEKQIAKKYEYIYSGQNEDIIKFHLKFNNTFYSAIGSSATNKNKDAVDAAKNKSETGEISVTGVGTGGDAKAALAEGGGFVLHPATIDDFGNRVPNASGINDQRRIVAQQFHNAFINSNTDMVQADLDIIGDPYYLVDSGMGNYFAQKIDAKFNADGTMDYEGGSVYIHLSLKTVVDIDPDSGMYNFQTSDGTGLTTNGGTAKVSPFGGIYKVNAVSHTFSDNVFKQKLSIVRMKGQSVDFEIEPDRTGPTGVTQELAAQSDAAALTDEEIAANNAALGDFPG